MLRPNKGQENRKMRIPSGKRIFADVFFTGLWIVFLPLMPLMGRVWWGIGFLPIYLQSIVLDIYIIPRILVAILILGILGNLSYLWFRKINWFLDFLFTGGLGFLVFVTFTVRLIYLLPFVINLGFVDWTDTVLTFIGLIILGAILNVTHRLIDSQLDKRLAQGFQGMQSKI